MPSLGKDAGADREVDGPAPDDAGADAAEDAEDGSVDAGADGSTDAGTDGSAADAGPDGSADAGPVGGNGTIRWARVIGGAQWDEIKGLGLTSAGDVTIAGQIENTVDAGCGPLAAQYRDVLVASYKAADGACRWSSRFGGANEDAAQAMAMGPGNVVYVGGTFWSPQFDLGGGNLPKFASSWDTPFVAAFADNGAGLGHQWSSSYLGRGGVYGISGGAAPSLVGMFYQDVQINGKGVTTCCPANEGMFAASLTAAGAATWAAGARITSSNAIDSVLGEDVVKTGGLVLVTGGVEAPADFGATHVIPVGLRDAFLAAYTASTGSLAWVKRWGVANNRGLGWHLVSEPGGTVLFAGTVSEGTDLGTGPLVGYGDHLFIARVDASGAFVNLMTLSVNYGNVFSLALRPDGRVVVLGTYRGMLPIAGKTLQSEPSGDPFIGVLSQDLATWEAAEPIGTPGEDFNPGRIQVSPQDGSIALALNFVGSVDIRGKHFTGPGGWDALIAVLE